LALVLSVWWLGDENSELPDVHGEVMRASSEDTGWESPVCTSGGWALDTTVWGQRIAGCVAGIDRRFGQ
jgi:hypothetical protein